MKMFVAFCDREVTKKNPLENSIALSSNSDKYGKDQNNLQFLRSLTSFSSPSEKTHFFSIKRQPLHFFNKKKNEIV